MLLLCKMYRGLSYFAKIVKKTLAIFLIFRDFFVIFEFSGL